MAAHLGEPHTLRAQEADLIERHNSKWARLPQIRPRLPEWYKNQRSLQNQNWGRIHPCPYEIIAAADSREVSSDFGLFILKQDT